MNATSPAHGMPQKRTYTTNIYPHMILRRTSSAVAAFIAEVEGCCPTELPPLDESVDTRQLRNLLLPDGFFALGGTAFAFLWAGYDISLDEYGDITAEFCR